MVAPTDYASFSIDLTFSNSTSMIHYNVTLVNDVITEGNEVFLVYLEALSTSNATFIYPSMAAVTIVDDDSKCVCYIYFIYPSMADVTIVDDDSKFVCYIYFYLSFHG